MGFNFNRMAQLIHNIDEATRNFLNEWHDDKNFIIAHTSGSTGVPKEIRLSKTDMIKSASATCRFFNINNKSTLVLPLSSNYIAGKMMIVRALVSDAELWIETPDNRPIKNNYPSIDLLPVVPSQLEWLLSGNINTNNIRNIIVGGGTISHTLEQKLISSGINAYATYGMTETCSHVALRHIGENVYTALPDISFSIDNRNCLIINASCFSFKQIITNDIVELIDNTHFIWKGRYDNVINTGGIKVFPEEIEKILSAFISIPFFITSQKSDKWGEEVIMYIETSNQDISKIEEIVRKKLDKYSIPKKIIPITKFDLTDSGKIIRKNY